MRFPLRPGVARAPLQLLSQRTFTTSPQSWRYVRDTAAIRLMKKEKKMEYKQSQRSKTVKKGSDPKTRLRFDKEYTGRHAMFWSTVLGRFQDVLKRLTSSEVSTVGVGEDELSRQAGLFMDVLEQAFVLAEQNITRRDKNPLFWNLRDAFILKDLKGLTNELQYSFQSFLIRQRFSKGLEESHKRLLDLRFPHEWFPATRAFQRTVHVHVGPTNSGKTYRALKALEKSKSGVYAGPLRLLANEVYQRLSAKGLPCALITGEEVRLPEDTDSFFTSCTVEMIPINQPFDVAVIDEIQMIADADRGTAWTTALLGVQAKEVHVCGEERTVKLLESLCASIGDKCVVHRYERLSPLAPMEEAINGDYNSLEKGDAIVAFSRLNLHALKRTVEKHTGRRCAIIYGSLPPEVRVQQAALFNDPDNDYDFVVASDAIGMGLNLEIRRVVLESVTKFDGSQNRLLTHPELKQIGGRAGRYRTARNATHAVSEAEVEEQKIGYVTTMDQQDLKVVHRAFDAKVDDITAAYVSPPTAVIERFSTYFPKDTPLSFILMRIRELASVSSNYRLGIATDMLEIADIIQNLPLNIYDRLTICHMPITLRAAGANEVLRSLANVIATNSNGDLLSIKSINLELLDIRPQDFEGSPQDYLYKLEFLHVAINAYVWLSYRYSGMFRDQELAFHVRSLVEQRLVESLEKMDFTDSDLITKRATQRIRAQTRDIDRTVLGEGTLEDVEQTSDDPPIDEVPEEWKQEEVAHAATPQ